LAFINIEQISAERSITIDYELVSGKVYAQAQKPQALTSTEFLRYVKVFFGSKSAGNQVFVANQAYIEYFQTQVQLKPPSPKVLKLRNL